MKNSCKITFEGLNLNRLLDCLAKKGIAVYGVEKQGKKCSVQVPSRRYGQTIAILKEKCYNIIGVEFFGIRKAVEFLKKHRFLPIICIVMAFLLFVSSQFCLKIEVSGDYDRQTVCTALEKVGVKVGADLHKLNLNALQNALSNELGAMYATVTRSGSVLYVNAVAKKEISPPIDVHSKRDLVATRSGVVVSVLCEQGTPLVKKGDSVQKGDVLIAGKRTYNDGKEEDVYALGRVTLSVSSEGFAPFDGTKTVTVETGREFCSTSVVLFGKEYGKSCPFEQYTVSTTVSYLYPLNLEIRENVYKETVSERVPATIEECLEKLQTEAKEKALSKCDFRFTDEVYQTSPDGVTVTLYGEVSIE